MNRHKILITILLVLNSTCLFAKLPDSWFFRHFRLGAEWGYSQCLYRSWSYNYFSEEGYRVYDDQQGWLLRPNGSVFLQIGYDLSAKVNVALNAGYLGTGENNRLLPVLLRLSYFPKTTTADGLFGWVQGGPALHFHTEERPVAWTESLGAGYRIALTEECNLDFLLGVRLTQDHPLIPNPEAPGYVSRHNILKNNAGYCALDLTIAVNF